MSSDQCRATMATHNAKCEDLYDAVERIPDLVNRNPALLRRGRFTSATLMIEIGVQPFYLSVTDGTVAPVERGPLLMRSWQFAVRGAEDGWRKFWRPLPEPRFHDIFALAKFGQFRIEGDLAPLMTNLFYFKELLAAPRQLAEAQ